MSQSPGKSTLEKQRSDRLDHKLGGPLSWTSVLDLRQATLTLRFSYSIPHISLPRQRSRGKEVTLPSKLTFPSRGKTLVWNICSLPCIPSPARSPQIQENQKVCPWRVRVLNSGELYLTDRRAVIKPSHLILSVGFVCLCVFVF